MDRLMAFILMMWSGEAVFIIYKFAGINLLNYLLVLNYCTNIDFI